MEVSTTPPPPLCLLIPTKANLDSNVVHQMHQYGVIYRLPPSKKAECFSSSLFSVSFCVLGAMGRLDSLFEKLHTELPILQIPG